MQRERGVAVLTGMQNQSHWVDEYDDEITSELTMLGSLVVAPVAVVDETAPLAEVVALLLEQKVPAVAVISTTAAPCGAAGHERSLVPEPTQTLRGLVTRHDVLRAPAGCCAGDVMSKVLSLGADTTVECAAALLVLESVWQVVVTNREGHLVGLVSAVDIARHMAVRAGYLAA
jgi:CBS domain-containing protein